MIFDIWFAVPRFIKALTMKLKAAKRKCSRKQKKWEDPVLIVSFFMVQIAKSRPWRLFQDLLILMKSKIKNFAELDSGYVWLQLGLL